MPTKPTLTEEQKHPSDLQSSTSMTPTKGDIQSTSPPSVPPSIPSSSSPPAAPRIGVPMVRELFHKKLTDRKIAATKKPSDSPPKGGKK